MKKLLFMLLCGVFALVFASCEKDEDKQLDPSHKIYITGVDKANKAIDGHLTPHEIVCLENITLMCQDVDCDIQMSFDHTTRNNLDTINNRLIMKAGNVIDVNGSPIENNGFLSAKEAYIVMDKDGCPEGDTIAYIPQSQRFEALAQLIELFPKGEYSKMYKIFDEALTFVPCTGKEYKAMKEANNFN